MYKSRSESRATRIERIDRVGLLMALVLHTVFVLLLFLRIYRFPDWGLWVVPVCTCIDVALWYIYQRELLSVSAMLGLVITVSYIFIFFYGVHPDVFFEMHFILGMFITGCSMIRGFEYVVMGTATYLLLIAYHLLVTREVQRIFAEGESDLHALMITVIVIMPIFLRYAIARRREEKVVHEDEVASMQDAIDRMSLFVSHIAGEGIASSHQTAAMLDELAERSSGDARDGAIAAAARTRRFEKRVHDIASLIDMARGKVVKALAKTSMRDLTDGIIEVCEAQARGTDVEVFYDFQASLPSAISADADKIKQIIAALAENAARESQRGAVRVSVTSRAADGAANLSISMDDTGPGIDGEVIDHAYRDSIPMVRNGRACMGLIGAIAAARIIDASITIESSPLGGTSATLCIPSEVLDETPWIRGDARGKTCVIYDPRVRTGDASRWFWGTIERIENELGVTLIVAPTPDAAESAAEQYRVDIVASSREAAGALGRDVCVIELPSRISTRSIADMFADPRPIEPGSTRSAVDILASLGADTAKGLEYSAGSREIYEDIASNMVRKLDARVAELQELYAAGDSASYKIKMHAIKSNLSMLGFGALSDAARDLERAADASALAEHRDEHDRLMASMKDIKRRFEHGQGEDQSIS